MHTFTIAWRELRAMFSTSMGFLVLTGFVFLLGLWWTATLMSYSAYMANVIENPYAQDQADLSSMLLTPFFKDGMAFILMMMTPAISMRLFSDELKSRSIELLFTSPVSTLEIVLGKYLGAMGFVAVMLLATGTIPASLYFLAEPDWGVVAGGYIACFLTCAVTVAIGMLYSSFTENAIVSLILGFATSMALWLLPYMTEDKEALIRKVCIGSHLESFASASLTVADTTYFASVVAFLLFATWQRVEGYRWR